eukprot:m.244078 g.244078  ORF g.244078 m.244078 type:complete len:1509 (+) comp33822_c0_seq1:144-4670(+)
MVDADDAMEFQFCGNRTFFGDYEGEPTDWFDSWNYSTCFAETFATSIPTVYLVFAFIIRMVYVSHLPRKNALQSSSHFLLKQVFTGLATLSVFAELIDAVWHGKYEFQIVSPSIMLFGMILAYILCELEHNRGFRLSKVLCAYWIAAFGIACMQLYGIINRMEDKSLTGKIQIRVGIFIGYFVSTTLITILTLTKEPPFVFEGVKPNPESSANLLSSISFSWLNKLMALGYSRPLVDDDLYGLNMEDQAPILAQQFKKTWDKQKKKKDPSLVRALFGAYGSTILAAAFFKLCQDLLAFVQPQLLKMFITYIEDRQPEDPDAEKPDQELGWELACAMFGVAIVQSICLHQYFHRMYKVGMRIRSGVMTAVYDKSLKLSNSARQSTTSGEIVNHMAIDAQRFMEVCNYLNMLWSAPLQIALSLYFLYDLMGWPIFAGLGVMVIMIPINGLVAMKERKVSRKLMAKKDERIRDMNEVLNGIKVIKMYAWERPFLELIHEERASELVYLKFAALWRALSMLSWTAAPFFVALATFAMYTKVDDNVLTPQTAFVALSLFNLLRFPLAMLPMVITAVVQAQVSVTRVKKFLLMEETKADNVTRLPPPGPYPSQLSSNDMPLVEIIDGMFAWTQQGFDTKPVLSNINMHVNNASICAIVGPVGCGKSSLVQTLLGSLEKMQGQVKVVGSIAYVPQIPWIQNATVRQNILFNLPFDPQRYQNTLEACALLNDLSILPAGDATEIGEKGINLSGGQKQRVSLARAVYSQAMIYILDDPLSAVDTHVGAHIFEKVIGPNGVLKDKCRVFVTHSVQYLPKCDHVVCMRTGVIEEQGKYDTLIKEKGPFSRFIEEFGSKQELAKETEVDRISSTKSISNDMSMSPASKGEFVAPSTKKPVAHSLNESKGDSERTPLIGQKLVEKEKSRKGKVLGIIYRKYFVAIGVCTFTLLNLMYLLAYTANVGTNYWLKEWSEGTNQFTIDEYIGVYGALGLGYSILIFFSTVSLAYGGISASTRFHSNMLKTVVRAPMAFFDTTPMGRIVNRFSQDIYTVDEMLPRTLSSFISCTMQVVSTVVVISISSVTFLAAVVPLAIMFFLIQRYYVQTSRQLKRLESVSRSPIYAHFSETLAGVASITAYDKNVLFVSENENKVDFNLQAYYPGVAANRWLAMRLEFLGNCIIFFAAIFSVIEDDNIDASTVGLALTYAMSVTQTLNWMVRMATELETNIVAVERIEEYTKVNVELPPILPHRPGLSWPNHGVVKFVDYSVRYREGLDLALENLNFHITEGEKIGIVGRTGAGKSTMALSLLRLLEPSNGKIIIDDEDISQMGLEDLRSKITIIPQDAVLFAGTVRKNVDPFHAYEDEAIWSALETSHLKKDIQAMPKALESEVTEGGSNFSAGQRQLICLARAVLRKSKILILDEATAACDLDTDDLIQKTIRREFADTTVLTIAHRLNTIMDSNRIMVLDKGKIAEMDSPANLIADRLSIFRGMVASEGLLEDPSIIASSVRDVDDSSTV